MCVCFFDTAKKGESEKKLLKFNAAYPLRNYFTHSEHSTVARAENSYKNRDIIERLQKSQSNTNNRETPPNVNEPKCPLKQQVRQLEPSQEVSTAKTPAYLVFTQKLKKKFKFQHSY